MIRTITFAFIMILAPGVFAVPTRPPLVDELRPDPDIVTIAPKQIAVVRGYPECPDWCIIGTQQGECLIVDGNGGEIWRQTQEAIRKGWMLHLRIRFGNVNPCPERCQRGWPRK